MRTDLADIELDYDSLMQEALRRVVHDVLSITADLKETPGEHHFYIEFLTGAQGVSIPDHLKEAYPSRMTIVLHHQFENLEVDEFGFSVSLWFKGMEAALVIPFDAITSFADPSAKFGLRFSEDDPSINIPGMNASDGDNTNEKYHTDNVETFHADRADKDAKTEKLSDKKPKSKKSKNKKKKDKSADDEHVDEHESSETTDASADIVSLDSFRKK